MIDLIKLEAAMRELSSKPLSLTGRLETPHFQGKELSAVIDQVTCVYSREFFELQLEVQLNIAKRQRGLLVIFAIEIENLAQLNDDDSHSTTNTALRKVAKCLSALFRRGTDFVARTESNQFMVLTLSMSREQAQAYLPAIRNRLKEIEMDGGCLSTKVGVTSYTPKLTESLSTQDLIESAHSELRADKTNFFD